MKARIDAITESGPTILRATWELTADDPEGEPVLVGNWQDKSWQTEGEFGTADVQLFGSNSGERYDRLAASAYPEIQAWPAPVAWAAPRIYDASADTAVRVTITGRRG